MNWRFLTAVFALLACVAFLSAMAAPAWGQEGVAKPKVAIFPLGGDAKEDLRAKVGFSLRSKLDREGTYEVLDGYTMAELVGEQRVDFSTELQHVQRLAEQVEAQILIWGELRNTDRGAELRVKIFDLLQLDPQPHELKRVIARSTDLRFVSEQILEALPDVRKFEHPSEQAVQRDATAEQLWETNPNLVANPGFEEEGRWEFIFRSIRRPLQIVDRLPIPDEAVITEVDGSRVLAIRMSRDAAETNGLAVLSDPIPIEPSTRYRLSFRYKSDGPRLHVFVKGYTMAENIKGERAEREIYRRQVPPTAGTNGQWVTIIDELNPQHVAFPVQHLRVDLYVYLNEGLVMFDDITLKAVGEQTRTAKDAAIDKPVERPAGK